jgi:medium-chain acyl-[acyl-carrier-protein] hydrolase
VDEELINSIDIHRDITEEYRDEILELMLPTIKSDFSICDTYLYERKNLLNIPITVLGSYTDEFHKPEALEYWKSETSATFNKYINFPGGHFYLDSHYQQIIKIICS